MSDRQIAATVRFGRKITIWPVDQDEVTGYVAGVDRFNYFLLVPDAEQPLVVHKFLVHKAGALIELHDSSTLDREPEELRDQLRRIIVPFRVKIMETYFPEVLDRQQQTGFSTA